MYIENWESFYQQAVNLYENSPLRTRFVTKYRHCDGKLVLKVTDDSTCLQYKTDQQSDLKRIEKLIGVFFGLMTIGELSDAAEDIEADLKEQQQIGQQPQQSGQPQRQKKARKG